MMELIQSLSSSAITAFCVMLAVIVISVCVVLVKRFGLVEVDIHVNVKVGGK